MQVEMIEDEVSWYEVKWDEVRWGKVSLKEIRRD